MRITPWVMSGSTIIVGLNGALQKRFVLPTGSHLIPGNVHRAVQIHTGVGGKGQDVAVTLTCLEYREDVVLAQFLGKGAEGDLLYQIIHNLLVKGRDQDDCMRLTVRSNSAMRTCTSIIADDSTTELVEPSGLITDQEMNQLLYRLSREQAVALCIMGSMPPGCPNDTYGRIYQIVATSNTLCVIDSVSGLEPLLKAIAAKEDRGPTILKINASELCRLVNVSKVNDEAGGVQTGELVQAVLKFLGANHPYARKALTAVAVTDGAHPSYLAMMPVAEEEEFRLFQIPVAKLKVDSTEKQRSSSGWGQWSSTLTAKTDEATSSALYPIGAGDAVAAGTLAAWKYLSSGSEATSSATSPQSSLHPAVQNLLKGNETPATRAILTAFSFGLACGSASCLQPENSYLRVEDVLELYNKEGRPTFISSHSL